jgi:hypothetical protein
MATPLNPIPWGTFPGECLWYLVPMSVFHLGVFIFGAILLAIFSTKQPGLILKRIGRFGLFLILFLLVSSISNGLWTCLVYNQLYHSTDYIFDFIPFWPVTWITVDTPWGDGHGKLFVPLYQLRLVWFAFAAGTWATTIALYRVLRRLKRKPDERTLEGLGQELPSSG